MRRFYYSGFCFLVCLESIAADPFDRLQRQSADSNISQSKIPSTKCVFDEPSLAMESTFEQLKLVGVVLYKNIPEALFLDPNQKLIVAKQGYRLAQEGNLLQQIRKDGVALLRAKAGQCEQTEKLEVRF
ncbi:hypothetical protein [Rodentibacter haemolyticus]|uniref:Pilus assembly protein PilP n=1 Tax=Rodentibacter haemolyticus TaxID=2778911 RepID=A0ABX6UU81_9PAST|nr:hypothetical protein [Rodentibacter haemolyticus]QPB41525.1 hypothetical protein IHV77_06080 [Rodentibacter haemolyticus]